MSRSHGSTRKLGRDLDKFPESDEVGIWKSKRTISIPLIDVVTFAFTYAVKYDEEKPIWVDARDPSKVVTRKSAKIMVEKLIRGLKRIGVSGKCVCLHAYNNIWYPVLWLAVIGAGGCLSGSNPSYKIPELIHHLQETRSTYIIAEIESLDDVCLVAKDCEIPRNHIYHFGDVITELKNGCQSWLTLLESGEDQCIQRNHERVSCLEPVFHATTSGTTGLPKSAIIPHHYYVSQGLMFEELLRGRQYEVRQLVCLPIFHAFAAQVALIFPLRTGTTTYFMPRFRTVDFLKYINQFSITDVTVVPTIISSLLGLQYSSQQQLKSLRSVVSAGALLSAEIETRFSRILSSETVVSQCWGLTEVGWITAFKHDEISIAGSVGHLLPNVQLKIIDEKGDVITEDNISGEAFVRSESMFREYQNRPESNEKAFDQDGFYKTGDRVLMRNDHVFITGRIADVIKVRGFQISPEEIENILLQHPAIDDAAVIGQTYVDDSGVEEMKLKAFVVKKASSVSGTDHFHGNTKIDENEVLELVASKFISYKHLSGGVAFVSKLPRSPAGKLLRRMLKDQAMMNSIDCSHT